MSASHSTPDKTDAISEKKSSSPIINYIWIGDPIEAGGPGIPGHDIGGPKSMAEVNKENPLIFWCLDAHVEKYREKFKEHKNIEVRSVEKHITECATDPRFEQSAKILQEILTRSLHTDERGSIRDRVTLKDAFSLFLLLSVGGYTLDTNIEPMNEKEHSLPKKDDIRVITFEKKPTSHLGVEVWTMYSPAVNLEVMQNIIVEFHKRWLETEELRKKEGPSEPYYRSLGPMITIPLFEAMRRKEISSFIATESPSGSFATVKELGTHKTLSNTHKFEMRKKYDSKFITSTGASEQVSEIFFAAGVGNTKALERLIKYGADINETINKKISGCYIGETPLHLAILTQQTASIELLLSKGADLEKKVNIPPLGGELSARELMMHERYKAVCEPILKKHDENQSRPVAKKAGPAPSASS